MSVGLQRAQTENLRGSKSLRIPLRQLDLQSTLDLGRIEFRKQLKENQEGENQVPRSQTQQKRIQSLPSQKSTAVIHTSQDTIVTSQAPIVQPVIQQPLQEDLNKDNLTPGQIAVAVFLFLFLVWEVMYYLPK